MVKKTRVCPACGEGTISARGEPGRFAMHHGVRLEIPADVELPTCDHCGERFFDDDTAARVDARLNEILDQRRYAVFRAALQRIERLTTRGKLETILDWSPGYISKMLRRGKVEQRTAALLELVAIDPGRLTQFLEALEDSSLVHRVSALENTASDGDKNRNLR